MQASGIEAPEWPSEALEHHYSHCVLSTRLSVERTVRELNGMREMLLATLRRAEAAEGGGEGGGQGGGKSDNRAKMAQTLSTYAKVCKCEAEQRAFLQRLPPPAPWHRAPLPPPYPRPAAPPPPPNPRPAAPPPQPSSPLAGVTVAASDAESEASTVRAAGADPKAAEHWLRGALVAWLVPCTPPTVSAQPKLTEVLQRTDPADVLARDRHRQLQEFQTPRPARRCFCTQRSGQACTVRLDTGGLRELMEDAPAPVRAFYTDAENLRNAVLSILHLPEGPILTRRPYPSSTVFGYRRRQRCAEAQ